MARPERKNVDYFPHYISSGKKMFYIESKYKNDGYAVWFRILEMLGSAENHYLNLNNEEDFMFISAKCYVSEDLLISIINDLAKIGAIDPEFWENKVVWSETFTKSIEDAYKKRQNKLMNKLSLCEHLLGLGILKGGINSVNSSINPQRIGKDRKGNYIIENELLEKKENILPKKEENKENEIHITIQSLSLTKESYIELKNKYSEKEVDYVLDRLKNYAGINKYKELAPEVDRWCESNRKNEKGPYMKPKETKMVR